MKNRPVVRNFLFTLTYLLLVPGGVFLILTFLGVLLGVQNLGTPLPLFVFMGLAAAVGGTLWARAVLRATSLENTMQPAAITGITYGFLVVLLGYGLELIEQSLFRRNLLNAPGAHTQFLLLFTAAILLVVGITSLVLTIRVLSPTNAVLYSVAAAILGALLFAAVDLLMYALGWRVGDLDQPDRSTMLTVTGLGLLVAVLGSGTAVGALTERAAAGGEVLPAPDPTEPA
ncbi:MAG: hypothetical protein R3335_07080 [Anaerolineales bacterium]|nr:hypothetical protein [Anaerolineales bacterium]